MDPLVVKLLRAAGLLAGALVLERVAEEVIVPERPRKRRRKRTRRAHRIPPRVASAYLEAQRRAKHRRGDVVGKKTGAQAEVIDLQKVGGVWTTGGSHG